MVASRKKLLICCAVGLVLLLVANLLVAIRQAGTRAGQTYRWVCTESSAEFSYNPSMFGSARLTPGNGAKGRWTLVEPRPASPALPWNWLTLVLDRPALDPEILIRQENLGTN